MSNAIHKTHKMTNWRSTIVTLINTPRFGYIRSCKYCGAEEAKTISGHAMHDELKHKCECAPAHSAKAHGCEVGE